MGKTTDELLDLANAVNTIPTKREMDMLLSTGEQVSMALLAMAIQALGHEAMSFTGWQAGIVTDDEFSSAKIEIVQADRIREELERGAIVVVAGFQGLTHDGDITTLGRGGSDTTAVALASGLDADVCEIYSDVDGIYTADPEKDPSATKFDKISYDEIYNRGLKVMDLTATTLCKENNLPIIVFDMDTVGNLKKVMMGENIGTLVY